MSSIRRRLLHGLGANSFGQVATVVIQIVSVPVFVSFWGVGLYGEWLILSTIPAYLAMSDAGFSSAAANEMTMRVSQARPDGALEVFQSAWLLIGCSSLLVILLVLSIPFVPLKDWLNIASSSEEQVTLVAVLLGLTVVAGLQSSLISAGFRCEGNHVFGVWINNVSRLSEAGAILAGVALGGGLVVAALMSLGVRVVTVAASMVILKRLSPWIVHGYRRATLGMIRQMAIPSLAFTAFPLGNAVKSQGMLTVCGVILGPAAVVTFSTLRTLANAALQVMSVINNTVWPELSIAYGSGNMELARKLHRYSCQISFWLTLVTIVFLAWFGDAIITVWSLGKVTMDAQLFYLLLAGMFANSLWFTSSVVPASVNRHAGMAVRFLAGTGVSVALALLLAPRLGLSGIAVGLLVIDMFMAVYVINTSLDILNDRFSTFLKSVMSFPERLGGL